VFLDLNLLRDYNVDYLPMLRFVFCVISMILIQLNFLNQIDQIEAEANEAIRNHHQVEIRVYQPGDPELANVSFSITGRFFVCL
jgi:hypothetical protein